MRGATIYPGGFFHHPGISIHAPHAGSDVFVLVKTVDCSQNFNPRSPCGERRSPPWAPLLPPRFQSTLPMRGATHWRPPSLLLPPISIHAPHAGSDYTLPVADIRAGFQSTLPMRGATLFHRTTSILKLISIHAPHAGSDHG